MYRMQVFDKSTTGMHWHIHKDGAHFFREYEKAGRKMEVAVAIGVEPAVTYAATAPMPRGVDEMLLAGFIRRKPVTLVPAVTVDIEVPAEADYVITLCAEADAACPALPARRERLAWHLDDPAAVPGNREQRLTAFRAVRDEIERRLRAFLARAGTEVRR